MIYGHVEILKEVQDSTAPVLLFHGPRSVGKWAVAEHLRRLWAVGESDILRVHNLSMDSARGIVQFSQVAPVGGLRLAIVDLVGAYPPALNVLLKVMEDDRPEVRFILIAEELPVATILSRAFRYDFKALSSENVEKILLDRNFSPTEAKRLSLLSDGSVERALKNSTLYDLKLGVLAVVRAFREKDARLLDSLAAKWTDAHTQLLSQWCIESISKDWKIFSESEAGLDGTQLQIKILMALRSDVRPRLVVRASLMNVMRGILA